MKDVKALIEEHKEALAKLRAKQKEELERVKAKNARVLERDRKVERKALNRAKFLLAGELVAEMKRTKDTSRLKALGDKQERAADKAAIERLIKYIKEAPPAEAKDKQRGLLG